MSKGKIWKGLAFAAMGLAGVFGGVDKSSAETKQVPVSNAEPQSAEQNPGSRASAGVVLIDGNLVHYHYADKNFGIVENRGPFGESFSVFGGGSGSGFFYSQSSGIPYYGTPYGYPYSYPYGLGYPYYGPVQPYPYYTPSYLPPPQYFVPGWGVPRPGVIISEPIIGVRPGYQPYPPVIGQPYPYPQPYLGSTLTEEDAERYMNKFLRVNNIEIVASNVDVEVENGDRFHADYILRTRDGRRIYVEYASEIQSREDSASLTRWQEIANEHGREYYVISATSRDGVYGALGEILDGTYRDRSYMNRDPVNMGYEGRTPDGIQFYIPDKAPWLENQDNQLPDGYPKENQGSQGNENQNSYTINGQL